MAKTNNLVLMGDCADSPCEQQDCGDATTVDVVVLNRRWRLTPTTASLVWTAHDLPPKPVDWDSLTAADVVSVACAPSFNGGMLACVVLTGLASSAVATKAMVCEVEVSGGLVHEPLAEFSEPAFNATNLASQESLGNVTFRRDLSGVMNVWSSGALEGPWYSGVEQYDCGGWFRIDDLLYALDVAAISIRRGTTDFGYGDGGGEGEEWLDLSTWFDSVLRMVYDDVRDRFYVSGHKDGDFQLYRFTPGATPDATLLSGPPDEEAIDDTSAITLLEDGLWWVDNENAKVWRYDIVGDELTLILARAEEFTSWIDLSPGGLNYHGVGEAFIVGPSHACRDDCACAPGLTLQRVIEAWPGVENCAAEHAETEGLNPLCCAATEEVAEEYAALSCRYIFDYEITLCEGRTLDRLVVQGARGRVRVLHEVDEEWVFFAWLDEITDFSTLPLVGRLQFDLAEEGDCGPHTSTLRVTAIDSANCCTRVLVPLACCRCCEPAGLASLTTDTPLDGYSNPHQYGGLDTWGTWNHSIEWVKLVLPATIALTDCTSIGSETAGCFLVEFDGAIMRDEDATAGGTPWADGYYPPNTEFRIKHDAGALGDHHCIKVTPIDPRGCPGPTQSLPLPYAYSLDPDEDPPTGAPWEDFFCEGWP